MNNFALIASGLIIMLASSPIHAATTVVDDSGSRVTMTSIPRRIVSVTPATTEMLFAVGDGSKVVGGTALDDYPPAATKIARIGDWSPNYERILALRPDLIVVDDIAEHDAVARLRSLHQRVLVVHPANIGQVEADMLLIGRATGAEPTARKAVTSMEMKIRRAASIAASDRRKPKVLPVIGHDPLWVAGSGTFIDDAIRRAGGINTAGQVQGYVQYSTEAVLGNPPDVIVAGLEDAVALERIPGFRALSAIRAHRVISIDPSLLQRPGPRLADGILQMSMALHPGARTR